MAVLRKLEARAVGCAAWLLLAAAGCGKPTAADRYTPADDVVAFRPLFQQHCTGCHGVEGKLGPAPPLNDPLFLSIVSDQQIEQVLRQGRPGTPMPPFGKKQGGALTDKQIQAIAAGLRSTWGAKEKPSGKLPPYAVAGGGNAAAGKTAFAAACAGCHGPDGQGGDKAGAINDGSFLTLISDQALRRIIITGRPDLKMPDFRREPRGPALTEQQIADLTALLGQWREQSNRVGSSANTMGGGDKK